MAFRSNSPNSKQGNSKINEFADSDCQSNDQNNGEDFEEDDCAEEKKKDKKLVFLSKSVLQKIKEKPMTTGT